MDLGALDHKVVVAVEEALLVEVLVAAVPVHGRRSSNTWKLFKWRCLYFSICVKRYAICDDRST